MPWYEENSYSPPSNRPVITFSSDHDGFDKILEFEIPSSIRKLKRLPDIEFDCFINPLGFAYDSENNDYKAVQISYSRKKLKVEVYTSKSDSWRTLEGLDVSLGPKIDFGFNISLPTPFFGGALHWLVDIIQGEEKHKTEMILSFDVNNETFEELAVPAHCFDIGAGHEFESKCVSLFREKLALIRFATVGEQSFACVWAIKEYGKHKSWNKPLVFFWQLI
ncbi:F-box/kelch-repeat protein At3g06240-like [Castanea sativa]|uniref:F-box/kelch-repeat protein At3g06240-like n=1 Tax=Castanea sativa TaxID=21020 RepID=UPI003F64D163